MDKYWPKSFTMEIHWPRSFTMEIHWPRSFIMEKFWPRSFTMKMNLVTEFYYGNLLVRTFTKKMHCQ